MCSCGVDLHLWSNSTNLDLHQSGYLVQFMVSQSIQGFTWAEVSCMLVGVPAACKHSFWVSVLESWSLHICYISQHDKHLIFVADCIADVDDGEDDSVWMAHGT